MGKCFKGVGQQTARGSCELMQSKLQGLRDSDKQKQHFLCFGFFDCVEYDFIVTKDKISERKVVMSIQDIV